MPSSLLSPSTAAPLSNTPLAADCSQTTRSIRQDLTDINRSMQNESQNEQGSKGIMNEKIAGLSELQENAFHAR